MSTAKFPSAVNQNGRLYFVEHEADNHVRRLANLPEKEAPPVVRLITAAEFAERLGLHRRSLGRRVREAALAAEQACA